MVDVNVPALEIDAAAFADVVGGDDATVATAANGRQTPSIQKVLKDQVRYKNGGTWVNPTVVPDFNTVLISPTDNAFYATQPGTVFPFNATVDPALDGSNWYVVQGIIMDSDASLNSLSVTTKVTTADMDIIDSQTSLMRTERRNNAASGTRQTDEATFINGALYGIQGYNSNGDDMFFDNRTPSGDTRFLRSGSIRVTIDANGDIDTIGSSIVQGSQAIGFSGTPQRSLHIQRASPVLVRLDRTDSNAVGIEYFGVSGSFIMYGQPSGAGMGAFIAATDNAVSLGNGSFRYSEVFAANGTINTSDMTLKTFMDNPELWNKILDAMDALEAGLYQWNDSIEKKGDKARIFAGYGAQQVEQALLDQGLTQVQVEQIRVVCKDTVEIKEEQDIVDGDGNLAYEQIQDTVTVQVPVTTYDELDNGKLVEIISMVDKEIGATEDVLLWHSNGHPDMHDVLVKEAVVDEDGNEIEPAVHEEQQRFITRPKMINGPVKREEVVVDTFVRYGLDYQMLHTLLLAAALRRVKALENA